MGSGSLDPPQFSEVLRQEGSRISIFRRQNRGAGLTLERGSLQIAERALSLMFDEFLPDIQQRLFRSKNLPAATNLQP